MSTARRESRPDPHWSSMFRTFRLSRRDWLCATAGALAVPARALPLPRDPVVLSISGRIRRPNREGRALFDMGMLASLPQRSVSLKTPWYSGPRKFTGPLLRDVLATAGAHGEQIEAIAINDYKVTIPMEDCIKHDVLLALLLDERPMPLRDKGPLFIIYPFDSDARLRTSLYYSRCAWQLKALDIR
jgi:hypothetical protein